MLTVCAVVQIEAGDYPQRWNYIRPDMGSDGGVDAFVALLQESKAAGCTHILINEGRYLRQAEDTAYVARVNRVLGAARSLNLTIVPAVYPFGYSGRYLGFDRNLAAGLPVRDMPFVVRGGRAVPDLAYAPDLSGLDTTHSGPLKVRPFTHYRISFLTTTAPEHLSRIISLNSRHRRHMRGHPRAVPAGERFLITATFNSLEADSLGLRIQAEGVIDSLRIEPTGLLMVLRRSLTPLVVAARDGKTRYEEGRDFEPVRDPVIAQTEGEMTMDHEAPAIVLTPHSRIREADRLGVSFFHAYRVEGEQDVISLEDPAVFDLMQKDIALCLKVWAPTEFFMNYDEIRVGGWEKPDVKLGATLATHIQKGCEIIRANAPGARIYTWSDMFTPFHNARPFEAREEYYYLANGNWDGAWEGLPKDVIVMNWYAKESEALAFFSDRGNSQILCGFYDARDEEALKKNVAHWMGLSEGVPNVLGTMYTTWERNYDSMNHFFELVNTFEKGRQEGKSGK